MGSSVWLCLLGFWLFCAVIAGIIASDKGRSGLGGAALGFLFGPIGILIVAVMSPSVAKVQSEQVDLNLQRVQQGDLKKCPFCAELIKSDAIVCRYCGRDLPSAPPPPKPQPVPPPVSVLVEPTVRVAEKSETSNHTLRIAILVGAALLICLIVAVLVGFYGFANLLLPRARPTLAALSPLPTATQVVRIARAADTAAPIGRNPETPARPSPTPPLALTPISEITLFICVRSANIRSGPGTTFPIVKTAQNTASVSATGMVGEWYSLGGGLFIHNSTVCNTKEQLTPSQPTLVPTQPPASQSSESSTFSVDDWEIRVTDVAFKDRLSGSGRAEKAHGRFAILFLHVTNRGYSTSTFVPVGITVIKDAEGHSYEPDGSATFDAQEIYNTDFGVSIDPDDSQDVVAVYDISPSSAWYKLSPGILADHHSNSILLPFQ